jgi:hypothetical protein
MGLFFLFLDLGSLTLALARAGLLSGRRLLGANGRIRDDLVFDAGRGRPRGKPGASLFGDSLASGITRASARTRTKGRGRSRSRNRSSSRDRDRARRTRGTGA